MPKDAGVRSIDAYVHADITINEKALALTTTASARPGRYHPPDKILAFLESLWLRRDDSARPTRSPARSGRYELGGEDLGIIAGSA